MSVLSRRLTVPAQRPADARESLDTQLPVPGPEAEQRVAPPEPDRSPARRRTALLVSAGVLAVAAAGTTIYVVADGGSPETAAPAAPAAPADGFNSGTETLRDAATAARGPAGVADSTHTTENLRDAATAARGGGTAAQTAESGSGLIP
jgi:hypothetical protein